MTAEIAAWVLLVALLTLVTWIDIREQRIPNWTNGALLLGGLAVADCPAAPGLPAALAGALLGGVFFLAVAVGFRRLRGIEGLGFGDVKFLVGAGAWTGWQGVGPTVLIAATGALTWLAVQRLAGAKHERNARIAFGPYLCVALLIVRNIESVENGHWEIFSR